MNPIAIIALLAVGYTVKYMADNYTGTKLIVNVASVEKLKLTIEGLQIHFRASVTNPERRSLKLEKAVMTTVANGKMTTREANLTGEITAKSQNSVPLITIIPFADVLSLIPLLDKGKLTNATLVIAIEIQAGGLKGSDQKLFNLDSIPYTKLLL